MLNYYQEVTDKWTTDYRVPLHTYIFDEKKRLVGYIPEGTTTEKWLSKPSSQWSGNRRKFIKIKSIQ